MDYSNYTLFEIIKYKIEFLDCLEYSLTTYIPDDDLEKNFAYLNKDFNEGFYYNIVSTLFTSFTYLNKPIKSFFKAYTPKKIKKESFRKTANTLIKYNEKLIDCHEIFNYIISAFTEEEELLKRLDNKILNLIKISNNHFYNFLFFNMYNLYINCLYNKNNIIKFNNKSIKKICNILSYCNKENAFTTSIEVLKEDKKEEIHKELERLSNICIRIEKEQHVLMNDLITFINKESKER